MAGGTFRWLVGALSAGAGAGLLALTSAMTAAFAFGTTETALIMGGTGDPDPVQTYVDAVFNTYIAPFYPTFAPTPLFTPEQFWPVTPNIGDMTFGQSVAQGVIDLNKAITQTYAGDDLLVFGYSQSATIATNEMTALDALPAGQRPDVSFMLIGDPNNPDGGLLERFDTFYIPILDVRFNGGTPPYTPYPTDIYTAQYDGIADAPQYPINPIADLNAVLGYVFVHGTYPTLTGGQVSDAVPEPTSPGYDGDTHYYMILTQNLPLLDPIREIPVVGAPIADLVQPDLRVLVDLGYGNIGYGFDYANIPTPARLFELPNPTAILFYLAIGSAQGPLASLADIGLLPQTALPDSYPFVPSPQPGLSLQLGQPSTTEVTVLAGLLGQLLAFIPPHMPTDAGSDAASAAAEALVPALSAFDPAVALDWLG